MHQLSELVLLSLYNNPVDYVEIAQCTIYSTANRILISFLIFYLHEADLALARVLDVVNENLCILFFVVRIQFRCRIIKRNLSSSIANLCQ